jgi:hypothetical protein
MINKRKFRRQLFQTNPFPWLAICHPHLTQGGDWLPSGEEEPRGVYSSLVRKKVVFVVDLSDFVTCFFSVGEIDKPAKANPFMY